MTNFHTLDFLVEGYKLKNLNIKSRMQIDLKYITQILKCLVEYP